MMTKTERNSLTKIMMFFLCHINHHESYLFLAQFSSKKTINFNMNNLISHYFQQVKSILDLFVGYMQLFLDYYLE